MSRKTLDAGSQDVARTRREATGSRRRARALLGLLLAAGAASRLTGQTVTLQATADTVLKANSANKNFGAVPSLVLREGGNRVLVRFDPAAIVAAVGGGSLASAQLQLYIGTNGANWGATGRAVDVYRLDADWVERGATWNCGDDANLANDAADCAAPWNGGAIESDATDSVVLSNASSGWIQFDVTADVQAFLAGTANDGWLIQKSDEGQAGRVDLVSREGAAGRGPQLVLVSESAAVDAVPPSLAVVAPAQPVVVNVPSPAIAVAYHDGGSGVDTSTLKILLDGQDLTASCAVGAGSATCTPPPLAAGTHSVTASLRDRAGNAASASKTFQLLLGPSIHTLTFAAAADTYLTARAADREHGRAAILRIAKNGPSRSLVQFDQAALAAALATSQVVSAQLELAIAANGDNWGASGRTVGAYPSTTAWSESAATWDCPDDTNLDNDQPDCAAPWNGGAFAASPTATVLHTRGLAGTVAFDVTSDVAGFLAGTANDGWLLKKVDETLSGRVDYVSREASSGQAAQLVVVFQVPSTDTSPPALAITSPSQPLLYNTVPAIAVSYSDTGSGVDTSSLRVAVDGTPLSGCTVGAAAASCPAPPLAAGSHGVLATVKDLAGNQATAGFGFQLVLDATPPGVSGLTPADGSLVNVPLPTVYATFSDSGSGIDPASLQLVLDGVDQTAAAAIAAGTILFTPAAALAQGAHTVTLTVKDAAGNQSTAASTFTLDTLPPVLTLDLPQIADGDPPPAQVQVSYADATSGVVVASFKLVLDGADLTAGCLLGPSSGVCPLPPALYGLHQISAAIADNAGNQATAASAFDDEPPAPAIGFTAPAAGSLVNTPSLLVQGTAAGRGGATVTGVTVNGVPARLVGGGFTATVPLSEGGNSLTAVATDDGGRAATAYSAVVLDTRNPLLALTTPADGQIFDTASVEVAGVASDENGLAELTVNGVPITLDGYDFDQQYPLAPGRNPLVLRAVDNAGNATALTLVVNRFTPPAVTITAPPDLAYLAVTTIDVTGTVSDPAATVAVNGVPATLTGSSFLAAGVPLIEGGNTLTAVAVTAGGTASTSVSVVRDLTPPHLSIDVPAAGAALFAPTVTVEGLVNDVVAGTVNTPQVTVSVNGVAATIANRSFVVPDLPLAVGSNVITVVATDVSGNVGQAAINVTRQPPSVAHLEATAGNNQQATIGNPLAQPLVVTLLDAAGLPIAGKPVVFKLRSNNGQLDGGRRAVVVTTDATGQAAAHFTLGTRAGAGNQLVDAAAAGFPGTPVFTATALPGPPAALVLDSGDQQVGIAGGDLAHPFVAVVTDAGHNRLAGVAVTFTAARGAGTFGGGGPQQLAVTSDSDGRAITRFTLDPNEGIANNVVTAQIAGNTSSPTVTFTASGRAAGDPAATTISGVVLDNTGQPVQGVTARILDSSLTAQADANGLFRLAPAPVGTVKLIVDGSTAGRPGSWPALEFELDTVPGRDNTVNMPIYLLPLDLANGKMVDETHGATLTSPAVPGFSLEIAPGSVTFPGGGKNGVVSVTLVHNDKVPMVPNFGQQPRLIVTIQPAGARFDPPARLTMPNLEGLAPGEVTEFYSFDHDLGHFVSIGPATASDDGSLVQSNPGVGIVKGGWHCNGNPATAGTAADCPPCYICNGSTCVLGCPASSPAAAPRAAARGTAAGFAAFAAAAAPRPASRAAAGWPGSATAAAAACNCHDSDCVVNNHCTDNGCMGTDVVVDSVDGPCFAVENTPVTFNAAANVPDHVKWTSPGNPSSGKGASFVTMLPAGRGQVVTASCTNSVNRTIDVLHACQDTGFAVLPLDPGDPALALIPGAYGVTMALLFVDSLAPCGKGGQQCITGHFTFKYGSHVADSIPGKQDVADSASDPHITAATCAQIIADFAPFADDQGPPRTQYWSRDITTQHEAVHAADLLSMVVNRTISDIQGYLAGLCAGCGGSPPSPAAVVAAIMGFFNAHIGQYNLGAELTAHHVSNQLYMNLISAIRQRARSEQWPKACQ